MPNKRIKSDVTHCPIFCLEENDAKKRPTCSAAYAGVRLLGVNCEQICKN